MPPAQPARSSAMPDPGILYGIQVLRGIASLLVVIRHTAKIMNDNSPTAFAHGQFGVDIFFVISGLVIFLTGRKQTASQFVSRRMIRIVPIYWLVLGVTVLGDVVRSNIAPNTLSNAVWSFLFIPSLDGSNQIFPPNIVGWSLNFEMFFYLICAGVLVIAGREMRLLVGTTAVIALAVVAGFAVRDLLPMQQYPATVLLLPITLEFLAGMWLAHFFLIGKRSPAWVAAVLLAAAFAWVAIAPTARPYTELRPLYWGIPGIAIVWAVLSTEGRIAYHKWKPALAVGDASYALYLVHPIVLAVMWAVFKKLGLADVRWLVFPLMIAGSLVAGLITHWVVERPITRILRGWLDRRPAAKPATAS
ncbi:MAG: acyltransferase [Novosphingobium sp.]|nr:acyltransferase [Novosphingobium sp.]